jgi:putative OPT family oligopeptide transporter
MKKQELELTVRAIIIGMVLAILLGGANVYLGLKVGTTISASVPASIISMLILKALKNYSIKENNIAQTTASIGEACAGAAIFILPALLITGVWQDFPYFEVIVIAISGGLLGIVYSAILRKILLADTSLKFPEGVAIANVLLMNKESNSKKDGFLLIFGMLFSGIFNLFTLGFHILSDAFYKFVKVKDTIYGGGFGLSVAIVSAGALMGYVAGIVMLVGFVIGWVILLPHFIRLHGIPANVTDFTKVAFTYWKIYIRPIGIGVLITGGIGIAIRLIKPISKGIVKSFKVLDSLKNFDNDLNHRKEEDRDLSFKVLSTIFAIAVLALFGIFLFNINQFNNFGLLINSFITATILIIVLILGFILASIAGYFAGLVGSSNSPGSSLNLISVIVLANVLLAMPVFFSANGFNGKALIGLIILLAAIIDFSNVPSNENSQDYKSGSLVGATPYKQQIALIFGLVGFCVFLPFFMQLIFHAYGIAGIIPANSNLDVNKTLSAPQASAIAALVTNIVQNQEDWSLIFIGMSIGVVAFALDLIGEKLGKFRFPVPALGTGFYLPPSISVSLFIGGMIDLIIKKIHKKTLVKHNYSEEIAAKLAKNKIRGELLLAGLIAGESIIGLILAIPFVIKGNSDALAIDLGTWYTPTIQSIITIAIVLFAIYRVIKISISYKK